ncbi:MAG TPA: B12-binding domain-containing protein [Acidimicrobiales bacterium]
MTPADPAATLTLQQVADQLGVHYMTAYRYVRTGQLAGVRRGGRWTVTAGDLAAFPRRAGDDAPGDAGSDGPYRTRLLDRLVAGDEAGAWRVVESALVSATTPDRAHLDLLAPCLRAVGDRWAAGTLTVGGEHVASAVAARLAARLAPLCARRGRHRGTLVVGGAPGELHGLPITLLANVLRARGWEVVELGPNTPTADLVGAASSADRLRAVGVSVGSAATLDAAAGTLAELGERLPEVPRLVGGSGVPDAAAARLLGGDAWAPDADGVDALLAGDPPHDRDTTPEGVDALLAGDPPHDRDTAPGGG